LTDSWSASVGTNWVYNPSADRQLTVVSLAVPLRPLQKNEEILKNGNVLVGLSGEWGRKTHNAKVLVHEKHGRKNLGSFKTLSAKRGTSKGSSSTFDPPAFTITAYMSALLLLNRNENSSTIEHKSLGRIVRIRLQP